MIAGVWLLLRPAAIALALWIAFAVLYLNLLPWAAAWLVFYELLVIAIFVVFFCFCVVRALTHLFRRRMLLAIAYALACAVVILCLARPLTIVNGLDLARFYASESFYSACIKAAPELGGDARFGVCQEHFLDPNFVRVTVYDSSDGLALPEGNQSASWKNFVLSFEGAELFGKCSFSSKLAARHFYFVDFNCEEPPLIRR